MEAHLMDGGKSYMDREAIQEGSVPLKRSSI